MIFLHTAIENFFSIGQTIRWEMENQGLVLICGDNLDSTSADSNGTGKSTLFEALVWCLWGKTTRGQTGDSVVNRKTKKDCCVEVQVQHNGIRYVIKRYRKHTKHRNGLEFFSVIDPSEVEDLTQGTTVLTQTKIESFLGIDYQTFIQGPMMPQGFFKKFSEMSDSEQKLVLEQALQIGVLAAALDVTKERLAVSRQRLSGAAEGLRQSWLRYEELMEQKASYEVEKGVWARKKVMALSLIAKEMMTEHFEEEHYWLYSQAANLQAVHDSTRTRDDLKLKRYSLEDEHRKEVATFQSELVEAKAKLKAAQADLTRMKRQIPALKSLSGECPTCQQNIDEDHVASCLKELYAKISKLDYKIYNLDDSISLQDEVDGWDSCVHGSTHDHHKALEALDVQLKDAEEIFEYHTSVVEQARRSNDDLQAARRREETVRSRFRQKQNEVPPYDQLIINADDSIRIQLSAVRKRKSEVRGLELEINHLEFWRTGFSNKGLKSYILRSVTPFLNDRVTRYVQALTGGELLIEFSTQTTLKSGETREKFAVLVTNRNGAETYAGNSGGEKSRADLAINFTLSDLISTRSRRPYPQRFLDEPFESLDESGVESVMELLAGMVVDAGSIFVVKHLDSMKGLFNKTIRLIKKNGQTRMAT